MSVEVIAKELLATDIVRLTLRAPEIAAAAGPGQFVMVRVAHDISPLLRRPFSIHYSDAQECLQILFKVVGKGTNILAQHEVGDTLDIIGPLGKGFTLPDAVSGRVCLVGGGMGIAPLYFLAKDLQRQRPGIEIRVFLGAVSGKELERLRDDFAGLGVNLALATDDGSLGYSGYVTDLLRQTLDQDQSWLFYSCGPKPMMKKVVAFCDSRKWPCQVSLETMMACGISACLGCTIRSSQPDDGSKPYLHVCKDGPVFQSGDVSWV